MFASQSRSFRITRRALALAVTPVLSGALLLGVQAGTAAAETTSTTTTRPTLELGDKSSYVLTVQQKLRVSPATGYFGVLTKAAVERFQTTHGIPALGIVGPRTWAALDSLRYTTVKPVSTYRISATFGLAGTNWSRTHTGLDFAAPTGTQVRAIQGGKIVAAGWNTAFGWRIRIQHADGTASLYAHMSKMFKTYGTVSAGTLIGAVGSTGNSTGPHLHLEVRTAANVPLDPRRWLSYRRVFV